MIKAVLKTDVGDILLLGLSHENLDLLKEGRPISFLLQEMMGTGWTPNTATSIVIMAGETEEGLIQQVKDAVEKENG